MHNVIYFMTECMFAFTKDGTEIHFLYLDFFLTPLHLAAANGNGVVVEILLHNGANINEKDVRN